MRHSTIIIGGLFLVACTGLSSTPVSWTPALESATQKTFQLAGEWRFTARSGGDFGRRCDILFSPDNTYRKSCRPPVEEAGQWVQVGDWDGHTMRIRLRDRVDMIAKRPVDDEEIAIVVATPEGDRIDFGGEEYERR